ncbi:MFS transporter [Nocardia sp. NPDC088792]|uniref:MFS transporter n=1 Tax=Nocardia sp. NPDC088792 TaxID=3364332 RepID=UPI0037FDE20F
MGQGRLGREFEWMWRAYAVSTLGTMVALDAFPLIAVFVLHSGAVQVSILSAAGLLVGALIAVPLGPWVEFRRKRPVMIGADLVRLGVLATVPVAFALGWLSYLQLVVVAMVMAAANLVYNSARGAFVKSLVGPGDLLQANGRFEATQWTTTALGPPLGGTAISVFGPVTTVVVDAVSYVCSALGLAAIGRGEAAPPARSGQRHALAEIGEGWRFILGHPRLRLLFFNAALVNSGIMAGGSLFAVLFLRELGFAPWQYGLAFGVPCIGGLIGSRLARPLAARFGEHRIMWVSGLVRACWPIGLAFVPGKPWGLPYVILIEFGLITSCSIFNPIFATYRQQQTPADRMARTLGAWSITTSSSIALMTVLWGFIGAAIGVREALGLVGLLLLATPLLLPRRESVPEPEQVPAAARESV